MFDGKEEMHFCGSVSVSIGDVMRSSGDNECDCKTGEGETDGEDALGEGEGRSDAITDDFTRVQVVEHVREDTRRESTSDRGDGRYGFLCKHFTVFARAVALLEQVRAQRTLHGERVLRLDFR